MRSGPEIVGSAENEIKVRVTDPTAITPNRIQWNLDMKVTLRKFQGSTIVQRIKRIGFLFTATIIFLFLFHLKEEVRALQVQMHGVNTNLLLMTFKYDKLSRNLNRMRICRSHEPWTKNLPSYSKKPYWKKGKSQNSDARFAADQPVLVLRESETRDKNPNSLEFPEIRRDDEKGEFLRARRSLLPMSKRNVSVNARLDQDEYYETEGSNEPGEIRMGKSRRDEGRGKKRGNGKRRPKRSRRRLGMAVATFIGAVPEQHLLNEVYIGPWVKSNKTDSRFSFSRFHLVENRMSIEVTVAGLYMITTQIYYFGEYKHHSYWILMSSEGSSVTQRLVTCATAPGFPNREVACNTNIVVPLKKGDRLYVQQQERDRLVNLREGYSYIQLILLSSVSDMKRRFS